jgi:rod shape-determining protein MreC
LKHKDWVIIGLLALGWVIVLGQPTTVAARLRGALTRLTTPLVKLGDWVPTVRSRRELAAENDRLRTEIEALQQRERVARELARENRRLERLLAMKARLPHATLAARVIGRDASNWWKSIQIDRGAADGVRENMAVINADGLVGKTIAVSRGEARVLLLLDPDCRVSALLEESREPGVAQGVVAQGRCEMLYVNRAARIQPGERVLTSGLGGIFPRGIPVGTVWEAGLDARSGLYQRLALEPAVDFNRLEEVLVIVGEE